MSGGLSGRTAWRWRLLPVLAIFTTGLLVLLAGLLPPGVIGTGQLDPLAWLWPALTGMALVLAVLRWRLGRLPVALWLPAAMAMTVPPLVLCLAGAERAVAGLGGLSGELAMAGDRPVVAVLSGPRLFAPVRARGAGAMAGGFAAAPLWQALARLLALRPVDALDAAALRDVAALLVVQPRQLAPAELVMLDRWVRGGGRAVLLADPDLHWADGRPLGDPLRPPRRSLLGPLLGHWGLTLGEAPPVAVGDDPVERRFLADGRLLQLAGASRFQVAQGPCRLVEDGLVARCRLGKGSAMVAADADFANDALWTIAPDRPGQSRYWTSDAVPVIADWLVPGAGAGAGQRGWLHHAGGLPAALRAALLILVCLSALPLVEVVRTRTKGELEALIPY